MTFYRDAHPSILLCNFQCVLSSCKDVWWCRSWCIVLLQDHRVYDFAWCPTSQMKLSYQRWLPASGTDENVLVGCNWRGGGRASCMCYMLEVVNGWKYIDGVFHIRHVTMKVWKLIAIIMFNRNDEYKKMSVPQWVTPFNNSGRPAQHDAIHRQCICENCLQQIILPFAHTPMSAAATCGAFHAKLCIWRVATAGDRNGVLHHRQRQKLTTRTGYIQYSHMFAQLHNNSQQCPPIPEVVE